MDTQLFNLKRKVNQYKEALENTKAYRIAWKQELKEKIVQTLNHLNTESELGAKVEVREEMENLNAVVLTLGDSKSGMYTEVGDEIQRHLIKHNGSLVYQQLFNGKIIVLINYPFIENYGRPNPPKTIAIYRPEELTDPFFIRHLEEFVTEITKWEDYDDDEPTKRIGFDMNFGPGPASLDTPPKEKVANKSK